MGLFICSSQKMSYLCTRIRQLVPWMSGLVSGLQNHVRRFESARYLKRELLREFSFFVSVSFTSQSFFHVLLAPKRTKRPGTRAQLCCLRCRFCFKITGADNIKHEICKAQENKRTNSPSSKGEWLKAEGVKTQPMRRRGRRARIYFFRQKNIRRRKMVGARPACPRMALLLFGKIVPLSGGRAACGGGGKTQPMRRMDTVCPEIFLDRRT